MLAGGKSGRLSERTNTRFKFVEDVIVKGGRARKCENGGVKLKQGSFMRFFLYENLHAGNHTSLKHTAQ